MLVMEQLQNPEPAKLQAKQNDSDVPQHFIGLEKHLIWSGVLAEDPEVMALVIRHIRQFFRVYQK